MVKSLTEMLSSSNSSFIQPLFYHFIKQNIVGESVENFGTLFLQYFPNCLITRSIK